MDIKTNNQLVAEHKIKEIIMTMNKLSEEDFRNKYLNDPFFHKGFRFLAQLFYEAKFDGNLKKLEYRPHELNWD